MAVEAPQQNNLNTQPADDNTTRLSSKEAKRELKAQRKREKKPGKVGLIILFVFLFLAVAAVVTWIFNIFDLREQVYIPLLRNVPIVSNLLPSPETAGAEQVLTQEQLLAKVQELETQLDKSDKDLKAANDKNKVFTDELTRLQAIEEQQLTFKAEKEAYERGVAENDPNAFVKFFESVSPETAESIYREIIGTVEENKNLKKYVATYQGMDETAAAKLLEELVTTDMDLVVLILKNIDNRKTSAILAAMTPANAARITKRMAP